MADPAPGGILALDLSSNAGWAYGPPGAPLPVTWGVWLLPQRRLAGRFNAFRTVYCRALDRFAPVLVFCEAPLPVQAQTQDLIARQQYGLAAYAEGEAAGCGIECVEQDVHTIRSEVIGRVRGFGGTPKRPRPGADRDLVGYPRRRDIKELVVGWAQEMGLPVGDHNIADACAAYVYAARHHGTVAARHHGVMVA